MTTQNVLEAEQRERLKQTIEKAIINLLTEQAARTMQESPVAKLWQALGDLLDTQQIYFAPKCGPDIPPAMGAKRLGWYDAERVYLLSNEALAEAKQYWRSLDETFDVKSDALNRQLEQQGYIVERGEEKHRARKTAIQGVNTRMLHLHRAKLEQDGLTFTTQQETNNDI